MPTRKKAIGRRLRAARLGVGLTVAEAARRLGRTRQSVHAWEAGDSMPDLETFVDVARLYRASADTILLGTQAALRRFDVMHAVFGRSGAPDRTR
jgi:transcriptional regulator with XRE-family HTH domain